MMLQNLMGILCNDVKRYQCIYIYILPKTGVPLIIHVIFGFSIINHPFWGTLVYGNTKKKSLFHHHSPLFSFINHHSPLWTSINHHSPLWTSINHHYPLVNEQLATENSHRNRWFTHQKWSCSIVSCMFTTGNKSPAITINHH